jgi:predicted ATPase
MTKAVLEAESEGQAYRTAGAVPRPALAVPASLHASLMARLDRLGPAKDVAQIGAAIGREFSHALLAALVRKPDAELAAALDRLVAAGLLFRDGTPPYATYFFKHALVRDAAYGTLLREPKRALHARIAEALETQFAEIAQSQPELLARHCTEAGLNEKAAALWGKAGQRSLEHSALVEAVEQLTRALGQIADLPATPVLRRKQMKLQIALITPLIHVKGYAAPETKAAAARARLLIEQAEALGEPLEDPLLLLSTLFGQWAANMYDFNGDVIGDLAAELMAFAEKQGLTTPLMIAHRVAGLSLLYMGDIARAKLELDRAIELYNPIEHRPLAARFAVDTRPSSLCYRSLALWLLGHSGAALADDEYALKDAREMGQAATLMLVLHFTSLTHILIGNYAVASERVSELEALVNEKGAAQWKAVGMLNRGCLLISTGRASDAVQMISSGIVAHRSTGATIRLPLYLSYLGIAYAEFGQFDDASRCIDEALMAVEATKERWYEAVVNCTAGEIALLSPVPDGAKAEGYFDRALAIARAQQAKSWELRAAMSMARLWRDRGKRQQAHDLLAPIYRWFTEGFDTVDLKQAKELLHELEQVS